MEPSDIIKEKETLLQMLKHDARVMADELMLLYNAGDEIGGNAMDAVERWRTK